MTHLQMTILLHYHANFNQYSSEVSNVSIGNALTHLLSQGFLVEATKGAYYETTSKAKAYIEALCKVPYPVQTWVIP